VALTQFVLDEGNTEVKVQAELRDLKFTRDYRNTIRYAEMKAHEKGLQQGVQQGLQQERRKMVMSMVENGISIDMASQIAELSQAEVEDMIKTVCD